MCGIAGIVDLDGAPIDLSLLDRMGESLRHRGPDAQGLFVDEQGAPSVGFVHRRLSIIDLSRRADQPIAGEDGSVCVMLNGEIYNFAQLRSELEKRHTFRSRGDTETIVHGYEEQGDDVVPRLDGMFAFALWDARRRRALLARDVFGKKPLYYAVAGRQLLFASEIKGILAAGFAARPAASNLPEYLAFGYVPTPRTFFRGVCKLPPSCTLAVDRNGVGDPRTVLGAEVSARRRSEARVRRRGRRGDGTSARRRRQKAARLRRPARRPSFGGGRFQRRRLDRRGVVGRPRANVLRRVRGGRPLRRAAARRGRRPSHRLRAPFRGGPPRRGGASRDAGPSPRRALR